MRTFAQKMQLEIEAHVRQQRETAKQAVRDMRERLNTGQVSMNTLCYELGWTAHLTEQMGWHEVSRYIHMAYSESLKMHIPCTAHIVVTEPLTKALESLKRLED